MFKSDKMKNAQFTDEQLRQIEQLRSLAKQKNAVIMAHYYTRPEIQEAADFIGDSLALSEKAANTDADIILFAGVHFMAETAKILSPQKKVLLPDPEAGCSLAASCEAKAFAEFLKQYPDYTVVSYVNTSVGVKALNSGRFRWMTENCMSISGISVTGVFRLKKSASPQNSPRVFPICASLL